MTDYPGTLRLDSQTADFNAHQFMIDQGLSKISHATLVQVTNVSTKGEVGPVGTISMVPLAKMQDAMGNVHAHGELHNIPYFRMQGGKDKAIIMDPKVGDIGIAIFADRDISAVKKNNAAWDGTKKVTDAQSPPGSFRQHDMADGMFFGCTLGGKPTSYVQFQDDGTIVFSPDDGVTLVTVKAGKITLTVKKTKIVLQDKRIDLGDDPAPLGVMLDGGLVSTLVFGKLAP